MDKDWDSYRRYLNGDDQGLVELIQDYKDGLIFFLLRYVGDVHTAEDLAEETFFHLAVKKSPFTPKASFKTWLYTIARNLALSHLRRAKWETALAETLPADEQALEESLLREERRAILHRALKRLDPDYARALHLKYFEDLSNPEVATVLGKGKRQVENLLTRARRALKAELQKEGFTDEDL